MQDIHWRNRVSNEWSRSCTELCCPYQLFVAAEIKAVRSVNNFTLSLRWECNAMIRFNTYYLWLIWHTNNTNPICIPCVICQRSFFRCNLGFIRISFWCSTALLIFKKYNQFKFYHYFHSSCKIFLHSNHIFDNSWRNYIQSLNHWNNSFFFEAGTGDRVKAWFLVMWRIDIIGFACQ